MDVAKFSICSLARQKFLKVIAIAILLISSYLLNAQAPTIKQWDYNYGGTNHESLYAFIYTKDGGFLLAGHTFSDISGDITESPRDTSTEGQGDWWVIKLNATGLKVWQKRLGGGEQDRLCSVIETADGSLLIGGSSLSLAGGDKTESSNGQSGWVVKLNADGEKEWDKTYYQGYVIQSLSESKNGGYLLAGAGAVLDSSRGAQDYWVIKIDTGGQKQWERTYGGPKADFLWASITCTDGGYVLGGHSQSNMGGDKTTPNWDTTGYFTDIWVVKIDSMGNKQWDKIFGGSKNDQLSDIKQSSDGGFILGGISLSPVSGNKSQANWGRQNNMFSDMWVVKIDANGTKQWDKCYGGIYPDYVGSVIVSTDGGYLFGGSSQSPIGGDKSEDNLKFIQSWMIKTDSAGIKQWDKTIFTQGGDGLLIGGRAVETLDHCYVVANDNSDSIGGYKSQLNWNPPENGRDFWIVKLCPDTTATGVINLKADERIALYPNPTNGKLYGVVSEVTEQSTIQITSIEGKAVLTGIPVTQANFEIDVSLLPAGIYFLQLSNEQQRVVRKFVKQ